MADQDPNRPTRPSVTPQPHQLLDADYKHTPYYVPTAEAARFGTHATPHLIVNLHHPPQEFPPETRNQFPGTDPIMDVREGVSRRLFLPFCVRHELMGVYEGRCEARRVEL